VLSSGRNVFEELGKDFTLLALGGQDGAVKRFQDAARSRQIPLRIVQDTYDGERMAYGSSLVLVRPDQYVVWAGEEVPADTASILTKVSGQG
jgi:hypothetical protein